MLWVVAPVDHSQVAPALDVSVTFPPAQKVVVPEAVMVGVAGNGFTVTVTGSDKGLSHPLELVTLTV